MTTTTNYGDAEPTAPEQRIAELEEQVSNLRILDVDLRRQLQSVTVDRNELRADWLEYSRRLANATDEAASLRAAVDTYAADLARVSAERDSLAKQIEHLAKRHPDHQPAPAYLAAQCRYYATGETGER